MTVKCIKEHQKEALCKAFKDGIGLPKLASVFNCSVSTIRRVLIEEGIHIPKEYNNRTETVKPVEIPQFDSPGATQLNLSVEGINTDDIIKHLTLAPDIQLATILNKVRHNRDAVKECPVCSQA